MLTDAYSATSDELREEIRELEANDRKANDRRIRFLCSVLNDLVHPVEPIEYAEIEATYPDVLDDQPDPFLF